MEVTDLGFNSAHKADETHIVILMVKEVGSMSRNRNQLEFSKTGSQAIQQQIVRSVEPIRETMIQIGRQVEESREWWRGESADAFLTLFEETSREITQEINEWLEANRELMAKIENIKFEGERGLAGSIRGGMRR